MNKAFRYIKAIALVLACAMVALSASAADEWYDTPIGMANGIKVIGKADGEVEQMSLHLRAKPDVVAGRRPTLQEWGIAWAYTSAGDMDRVVVSVPTRGRFDDFIEPRSKVSLQTVRGGQVATIETIETSAFDIDGGENSLVIRYSDGVLRVSGGASEAQTFFSVPYHVDTGEIVAFTETPLKCRRIKADVDSRDKPRSRFASLDALDAYLSQSTDPIEGYWTYIDRKTDPKKAVLGGRYVIAVVRNADHYDIVYISGAEVASSLWTTLDLKGRLRPTTFVGNYDLEWIDTSRRSITGDSNAQLSDDKAVLSLRLPELGAELRFARQ